MAVNWFSVLGLTPGTFTEQALAEAWRRFLLVAHPDKGGSQEAFVRVQEAHSILLSGSSTSKS